MLQVFSQFIFCNRIWICRIAGMSSLRHPSCMPYSKQVPVTVIFFKPLLIKFLKKLYAVANLFLYEMMIYNLANLPMQDVLQYRVDKKIENNLLMNQIE